VHCDPPPAGVDTTARVTLSAGPVQIWLQRVDAR
jgi:hypothetical protein